MKNKSKHVSCLKTQAKLHYLRQNPHEITMIAPRRSHKKGHLCTKKPQTFGEAIAPRLCPPSAAIAAATRARMRAAQRGDLLETEVASGWVKREEQTEWGWHKEILIERDREETFFPNIT